MSKPILISIFDKNETKNRVLYGNGLAVLDNICIKCITDEEGGNYPLEATFIIDDNGIYKYITEEAILKVKMDYGTELFRISHINPSSNFIDIYAMQLTESDTLDIHLSDVRPTNTNAQGALDHMLTNSNEYKANKAYAKNIELFSDIAKLSTAYYQDMSLYQALHDSDQSFEKRWGSCEIQRRGYRVNLMDKIGQDRGFQVRSRKNLTGFEYETNTDNLVTRIKPKGFNGITIDGYVDSPLISKYSKIKTKVIKYEDVKVKDENSEEGFDTLEQAQAELIRKSGLEFTENHIDEIKAKYNISFVSLEKTEQYKDYAILERAYVGDTVTVIEEKLGINIKVRVIKRRFDVLKQSVIDMDLSNYDISNNAISIVDIIKDLENVPDEENILQKAKENATNMINNGMVNSHVVLRKNELFVGDAPRIEDMVKVWRWNKNGLGFSNSGVTGEFGLALTADGSIVATKITTGTLSANLIKTGVLSTVLIKNSDGSFEIDLSKSGGCLFRNNGKNALEIANNKIDLFNWAVAGDYIGSLGSLYDSTNRVAMLSMYNDLDSVVTIGYNKSNNTVGTYMEFDKYGLRNDATYPIQAWENMRCNRDLKVEGTLRTDYIKPRADNTAMLIDCTNLTVTGNIYASNVGRAATMALEKDSNEEYRLVTKGELMSEIEQLKAQIKQLKALVVK